MKIINHTEVFEPSECIFCITEDPEGSSDMMVYITDLATWEAEGCLNDCFGDHSVPDKTIPNDIFNLMEATWGTELSEIDARSAMLAAGFVESQELYDFMLDHQ